MAENRINQALENIINGEPFENPRTDDEVMLSKIAAGEEVTENTRNRFQYWLKQIEVGGGGNPNYVETIEGTVANPWGNMTAFEVSALRDKIITKDASAIMTITVQQYKLSFYLTPSGAFELEGSAVFYNSDPLDINEAYAVRYKATEATLNYLYGTSGGVSSDYTQYAAAFPTTLTIIYHPLRR